MPQINLDTQSLVRVGQNLKQYQDSPNMASYQDSYKILVGWGKEIKEGFLQADDAGRAELSRLLGIYGPKGPRKGELKG